MNTVETIVGNKLIWNFMGGKWQPTEKAGHSGMRAYEPIWNSYEECEAACVEINKHKGGSPRQIDYAVPSPYKNTIDRELKYHSSWDWLMPVVEKINKDGKFMVVIRFDANGNNGIYGCYIDKISWVSNYIQNERICGNSNISNPIEVVWKTIVKFIQWYTTQTPSVNK